MARETINGISVPIPGTGEPADFVGDLRQIATDLSASTADMIEPGETDPQVAVDTRVETAAVGAGVARFIARANAGATLKIVGIGDSILAGTGATLGTDDALTRTLVALQARFPSATITQSNRALSGATTATIAITGYLASAIADAGDLYVIGFGRNDAQADDAAWGTQPIQGYRRPRSLRYFEVMIRAIRAANPQADILLVTENPASVYSGDTNMRTYQQGVRDLAKAYGCELADTYAAYGTSGYSSLLTDAVHPSVAGHQLYADTIMERVPASLGPVGVGRAAATLAKGLRKPEGVDTLVGTYGWTVVNGSSPTAAYVQNGAGWNAIYPRETAGAGDYMEWTFTGTDFGIRVDQTASAAPVVHIDIDGVRAFSNQSLYLSPSTSQLYQFLATGLTDGQHVIRVTLVSGTLRWYQAAWLSGAPTASTLGISGGLRKMVTGRYYTQRRGGGGATPIAFPAAGDIYCVPLWVPKAMSFDKLGVYCSTLAASSTVTLGVYSSDANDQPGTQLLATAALDTSTTGWKEATVSLTTTDAGWLWLAALVLGGTPRFHASDLSHDLVSSTAQTFANALNGYRATGASALPTTWASTTAVTLSPLVGLRAA